MTAPPFRPIRTLLVANRAEIARRVFRTAREMGIGTVAVFSDADDGAPHMAEADIAVRLAGTAASDTYLRGDLIIAAARASGADAVHPGYGFLSENAQFARDCAAAGLTFVGPSPEAIEQMGSKVAAKLRMAAAGVPVLEGFTVSPSSSTAELVAAAESIGFPVLVKAAFGGGGRGMRIVRTAADVAEAVAAAQREAEAAFGDGTVFLERYVESPRHIEVQIFGDHHGNVISLFERECSIQRRHQKVIEEAPSPVVTPDQRADLGAAARAAGESLGYVGAGTVEFVMDADGGFFFLEVNTRLQVEHPVTEMITGLDLVRLQLEVAQGRPLPPVAIDATITGHAVEARLYAEDVPAGFVPTSGAIHRLRFPAAGGSARVRVDSGYGDGGAVSTFYDAMIAKVIAWAPTREEAAAVLADTLARTQIHGVVTNRDLLVSTLRHPDFTTGRTDTAFFDRNDHQLLGADRTALGAHHVHAIAAALAPHSGPSPQPQHIPTGWRNVGASVAMTHVLLNELSIAVAVERSRRAVRVAVDGEGFVPITVVGSSPDLVEFELLGMRHRVHLHRVAGHVFADSASGASDLMEVSRLPVPAPQQAAGSLLAPMPGTVVGLHAVIGEFVQAGQTLVALEAMKMEHAIRAPRAGVVLAVAVALGDHVAAGAVLAVISDDESD